MFPDGILTPPESAVAQAAKTVSAMGEKELKDLILKHTTTTTNAIKESGVEIDWTKCTSLTGKTAEEKCENLQTIQAELAAATKRRSDLQNKSILTDRNEARIEAIQNAANSDESFKQHADRLVTNLRNQIMGIAGGNGVNIGNALATQLHEDFTPPTNFDGRDAIKNHFLRKGSLKLENAGLDDLVRTAQNAMSTQLGTDGGFQVIAPVSDTVVDLYRRALEVVNLFPRVEVPYPQYIYIRETEPLASVAGAALPFQVEGSTGISGTELKYKWEKQVVEVRELMVYAKVTGQQLGYVPTLQGRINNNLTYDALRRLDSQLINGVSTVGAGEIGSPKGPVTTGNANVQTTQLMGLDAHITAAETIAFPVTAANANTLTGSVYAANDKFYGTDVVAFMIKDIMEEGGATMDFLLMNPTNWAQISILRDTNGVRLIGDEQTRATPSLIGVPVVQSPAVAAGNLFGGARMWAELPFMNGVDLAMTDTHGNDFLANLITVRLMLRAALAVLRVKAFKKVSSFKAVATLT